jgi:hypothetical protein
MRSVGGGNTGNKGSVFAVMCYFVGLFVCWFLFGCLVGGVVLFGLLF